MQLWLLHATASMLTLNVISCGRYYWKMHSLLLINSLTPISEWLQHLYNFSFPFQYPSIKCKKLMRIIEMITNSKVSLSSLGNVKRKVQRIQILMLGMGGCHRQQYRHNKSFVINRNGLLVFWRTVYVISRDLFKIQMVTSHLWWNEIFKQKMVYTIRTFLFITNH